MKLKILIVLLICVQVPFCVFGISISDSPFSVQKIGKLPSINSRPNPGLSGVISGIIDDKLILIDLNKFL